MLLSTVVNRAVLRGVLADSLTALCCYYNVSDVVVICRFDVLISYMTAAVFDGSFFYHNYSYYYYYHGHYFYLIAILLCILQT